jgi:hypothetical protein
MSEYVEIMERTVGTKPPIISELKMILTIATAVNQLYGLCQILRIVVFGLEDIAMSYGLVLLISSIKIASCMDIL